MPSIPDTQVPQPSAAFYRSGFRSAGALAAELSVIASALGLSTRDLREMTQTEILAMFDAAEQLLASIVAPADYERDDEPTGGPLPDGVEGYPVGGEHR